MRPNTSSAITLPMEAIADRSNPTASTMASAAVITRPVPTRPPNRRPITGGTGLMEAISSHSPVAGYSPALVAPAVANRAVTLIIQ